MLTTVLGVCASILTTASYVPQLVKAWRTGAADDLSLKMLFILLSGLVLWVAYGARQGDLVIVVANGVSAMLLSAIIILKSRSRRGKASREG